MGIALLRTLADRYTAIPYEGKWLGLWQNHRSLANLGTIDIGIAHSRDGLNWRRIRATEHIMLPLGEVGQWDRFNQAGATRPIQVGDELWYYYSGRTYRHGEYKGSDNGPSSSKGGIRIGLLLCTFLRGLSFICPLRLGPGNCFKLIGVT